MSKQHWLEDVEMRHPTAVLKIGGRIGATAAKELRNRCAELREQGYKHLIVNMAEVTFVASSGIGALVVLSGECDIGGGSARFVSMSAPAYRVIQLLNLQHFLIVEADEAEAMANIGATV